MKFKRWLSVLLVMCMLATFVPSAVMEEAIELPVEEVQFELGDDSIQTEEEDLPDVNQEMTFELSTATDDFVDQDSDSIDAQLASGGVAFDAAHFPDAVFRERIRFADQNDDGFLSTSELNQVTELSILPYTETIRSITGIEYFSYVRFLDCGGLTIIWSLSARIAATQRMAVSMVYSAYMIPAPPSIDSNTNNWGSAPNPEVYRFGFPREQCSRPIWGPFWTFWNTTLKGGSEPRYGHCGCHNTGSE